MMNWHSTCSFTVGAPDTTPPSTPTNVSAAAQSETSIALTWSASSDPESGISAYRVYRDGVSVAQPNSPGYVDTGLLENTM